MCVCVCVCYLINCEYFNNLNGDKDMVGTCIMTGMRTRIGRICTSLCPSPYLIEKVRNTPYIYSYLVNVEILRHK